MNLNFTLLNKNKQDKNYIKKFTNSLTLSFGLK